MRSRSWFIVFMLVIAMELTWRTGNIYKLYTDSSLRERFLTALNIVADERGWLLSDVSIRSVQEDSVMVRHSVHQRSFLLEHECYVIALDPPALHLCEK